MLNPVSVNYIKYLVLQQSNTRSLNMRLQPWKARRATLKTSSRSSSRKMKSWLKCTNKRRMLCSSKWCFQQILIPLFFFSYYSLKKMLPQFLSMSELVYTSKWFFFIKVGAVLEVFCIIMCFLDVMMLCGIKLYC